jgi:hypothetical protein
MVNDSHRTEVDDHLGPETLTLHGFDEHLKPKGSPSSPATKVLEGTGTPTDA